MHMLRDAHLQIVSNTIFINVNVVSIILIFKTVQITLTCKKKLFTQKKRKTWWNDVA